MTVWKIQHECNSSVNTKRQKNNSLWQNIRANIHDLLNYELWLLAANALTGIMHFLNNLTASWIYVFYTPKQYRVS